MSKFDFSEFFDMLKETPPGEGKRSSRGKNAERVVKLQMELASMEEQVEIYKEALYNACATLDCYSGWSGDTYEYDPNISTMEEYREHFLKEAEKIVKEGE